MNIVRSLILLVAVTLFLNSCKRGESDYEAILKEPALFSNAVNGLTDVITYDIFSPPVASRIYAYSSLAAYEVVAAGSTDFSSLITTFNGKIGVPEPPKKVNFELASVLAFLNVGQKLTFSKNLTQKLIDSVLLVAKSHGMPEESIDSSYSYATKISSIVIDYSKSDHYAQTRSGVKYTVDTQEGRWVPTPPAYMKAVEPNWMKIRPIILDSAEQIKAKPHPRFSLDKQTRFYKMVNEVYTAGKHLTPEQKAIADFWDCNGFKLHVSGHVMFATKAMTPAGHWMGITGIVCGSQKSDFKQTVYTYASVSFALMDGFISCWSTKFKYNLLRPETYINLHIDNTWKPYIQTPPFPEYTSGHSIISSAVATVLSGIFKENTAFTDTTERRWGWPDRTYSSVNDAAQEAAISRLYGGIHYQESIDEGLNSGSQIGKLVLGKMELLRTPSVN